VLDIPVDAPSLLIDRSTNMREPADQQPSTRERLIFTAMQLFWEKGYASTSVADVLHEGKVNSGSLYYFFPDKQDLLLAVLETYRQGIDEMLLAPAWKGVTDPIDKIFALLTQAQAKNGWTTMFKLTMRRSS
jgi:AcrR family transcriptional regulator